MLKKSVTSARRVMFRRRTNSNLCIHSLTRKITAFTSSIRLQTSTNIASCASYNRTDYNELTSEASACRSTTTECFFKTALLDTDNEASHSSGVTALFAMFQVKCSSMTAADGSVTVGRSNSVTSICKCRN